MALSHKYRRIENMRRIFKTSFREWIGYASDDVIIKLLKVLSIPSVGEPLFGENDSNLPGRFLKMWQSGFKTKSERLDALMQLDGLLSRFSLIIPVANNLMSQRRANYMLELYVSQKGNDHNVALSTSSAMVSQLVTSMIPKNSWYDTSFGRYIASQDGIMYIVDESLHLNIVINKIEELM